MRTLKNIITPEGFNPDANLTNPDTGGLQRKKARANLKGVKLYGFEFFSLEGHGSTICFRHEELAVKLYATPNYNGDGQIDIAVKGEHGTFLRAPLEGNAVHQVDAPQHLSVVKYLQILRDFLEANLLNSEYEEEVT